MEFVKWGRRISCGNRETDTFKTQFMSTLNEWVLSLIILRENCHQTGGIVVSIYEDNLWEHHKKRVIGIIPGKPRGKLHSPDIESKRLWTILLDEWFTRVRIGFCDTETRESITHRSKIRGTCPFKEPAAFYKYVWSHRNDPPVWKNYGIDGKIRAVPLYAAFCI